MSDKAVAITLFALWLPVIIVVISILLSDSSLDKALGLYVDKETDTEDYDGAEYTYD